MSHHHVSHLEDETFEFTYPTPQWVKKIAQDDLLVKLFVTLGYPRMGIEEEAPNISYKFLYQALYECDISRAINLFRTFLLQDGGMSSKLRCVAWASKNLIARGVYADVIIVGKYFSKNNPTIKTKLEAAKIQKCAFDNECVETTSGTLRAPDLPRMSGTEDFLQWFGWRDIAMARLKVLGLDKVITDVGYALSHPRQNACVDGLLQGAIFECSDQPHYALAMERGAIDGNGHERWKLLVQANEHPEMVKIILKDLKNWYDSLELKSIKEFGLFSSNFFIIIDRITYIIEKGKDHKMYDSLKEYKPNDTKEDYCNKVSKCKGLDAIALKYKEDTTHGLKDVYMKIKKHLVQNGHLTYHGTSGNKAASSARIQVSNPTTTTKATSQTGDKDQSDEIEKLQRQLQSKNNTINQLTAANTKYKTVNRNCWEVQKQSKSQELFNALKGVKANSKTTTPEPALKKQTRFEKRRNEKRKLGLVDETEADEDLSERKQKKKRSRSKSKKARKSQEAASAPSDTEEEMVSGPPNKYELRRMTFDMDSYERRGYESS